MNWMLTRLGVAMFLTMALMMLTPYLYGQDLYATREDMASPFWADLRDLLQYLCLFFATPVFLILGMPIASNAIANWRRGIPSTDALVMLGVAAAFASSYVATLTGRGGVYYEPACVVLVLITLGRWLEAHGKWKASNAVKNLRSLIPDQVTVLRDGQPVSIASSDIQVGDLLRVAAGASIAADGIIEEGGGHIDEQMMTGESTPVVLGVGDSVHSGTIACDGALSVRVTAVGTSSTFGRLLDLLEVARQSKGHYERLAEYVTRFFVPITLLLSAIAAFIGFKTVGLERGIMSALAVMLIACPCALGIATPLAIWIGLGNAARHGVLFRSAEAMEKLARVKAVCFDKTGTLTTGHPLVSAFQVEEHGGKSQDWILSVAAGLASRSNHLLSAGITRFAETRGLKVASVENVMTAPGRGLSGQCDGKTVFLGNAAFMKEHCLHSDNLMSNAVDRATAAAEVFACVGCNGRIVAVFTFSEDLRPDAAQAIQNLRNQNITVAILTGDHQKRGEEIARVLGTDVYAGLLPGDKIERLRELRASYGEIAMVGDGLNDAPSLAAANVGIAMGCGADLTRESADVCLLGNDPSVLPFTISLARRTVRTIRSNLFFAFIYNVAGIGLAMVGRLNPAFAAAAMVVSSVFVVTNSLRLHSDALDGRVNTERKDGEVTLIPRSGSIGKAASLNGLGGAA